MGRLGPVTILDSDIHDDVWVNGGEVRPQYHVTLPVATPSAAMDRVSPSPRRLAVSWSTGRRANNALPLRWPPLAVMIDRHAVEDELPMRSGVR